MLHVSYIIPNMALWHLVFSELSKHKPQAVSKNINHLLHSLIVLCSSASPPGPALVPHL